MLRGETPVDTKSCPSAILSITNATWPDLEYKAALLIATHFRITIFHRYFVSIFCFLVLYICTHSLTHTHTYTQHPSVSCLCAICQLQSYYGAFSAALSMHTVQQYKGHFCCTLYYV